MILRTIGTLIALLNSNSRPGEIGAGVAYGLLLALVPANNLLFYAPLVLAFFLKIHLGLTLVLAMVFSFLTALVDPSLNALGVWLLTRSGLQELFSAAYTLPIVPWTRFNDGLVLGSVVAGIALFVPVTFLSALLVNAYRTSIHSRIANSKLVKAIERMPIVQKLAGATAKARRLWPSS